MENFEKPQAKQEICPLPWTNSNEMNKWQKRKQIKSKLKMEQAKKCIGESTGGGFFCLAKNER